ncbi:hypothetical protein [Paenibacillus sp. SI8]|uniref:hypothetical protein n=1 Tax=unclassified Paenibacillus TaxID=185978 RepID=UPI0034675A8B
MKIIAIFIFLFLLSAAFDIVLNRMMGMSLRQSMSNLINPFSVKGTSEWVTVALLILIWIGVGIRKE